MNKNLLLIKELRSNTGASIIECKKALLKNNNELNKAINYINKYGKGNKLNIKYKILNEGLILDKIISINKTQFLGCLMELGCETDFVAKNEEFYISADRILNFVIKNKIFDLKKLNNKIKPFLITLMNKFGEKIQVTKLHYLVGNYITSYNHNKKIGVLISLIKKNNISNTSIINKQIAMHIAAKNPLYISLKNIPKDILTKEYEKEVFIANKTGKSANIIKKIVNNRLIDWQKDICLYQQSFIFDHSINMEKVFKDNNIFIYHSIRIELGKNILNEIKNY